MRDVVIIGVGMTQFGRHPDKSLKDLGREACLNAMRDAGISPKQIEAGYCGNALAPAIQGETGVWLCMKYEIPQMLKQGGGAIVNTASVAGLIGTPGISPYTASKHGVVGITKTVALEYAKAGIRVNAICPGAINTPLVTRAITNNPELEKILLDCHPVGRFGKPDEVAEAVVWLCSDSASFVTGHAMAIDGGLTAQ